MTAGWAWILFAALILSILTISGCSDNPVAPHKAVVTTLEDENPPDFNGFDATPIFESYDSTCFYGSGWATPFLGGMVRLNIGSPINRLIIPRMAVPRPVLIEATTCVYANREGEGEKFLEIDFLPDDLVFKRPARLVFDLKTLKNLIKLDIIDGKEIKLYYYDSETEQWEFDQTARIFGGLVIFEIRHFSKFGISD